MEELFKIILVKKEKKETFMILKDSLEIFLKESMEELLKKVLGGFFE